MLAAILKTKPKFPECIATNYGWVNPINNEVMVSFKQLKNKLEKLQPMQEETKPNETVVETPAPAKRKYKKSQQLIGEVMEYPDVDFTPEVTEITDLG